MLKDLLSEQLKKTVAVYAVRPEKSSMDEPCKMSNSEYRPSIYLDSDALPNIKDWEVDEEYYILMKVKQCSKSMNTVGKEEKYDGRFEIMEVAALEAGESKEHEEKEDEGIKKAYGL